ncbi:hypothetical protein ACFYRG_45870 [Streptomyces mirabilis]|uniref:hypothetical protein n=1 Tax=Streptomyces mirabilis TaxID=68239 RepID=UPI0036926889
MTSVTRMLPSAAALVIPGEEAVAGGGVRGAVGGAVGTADGQAEEVSQQFLGLPRREDLSAVGAHVIQLDLE